MTVEFASILPTNSTPWERAVEQASGERWDDLDIDIIRRSKDPWRCPAHLLNFLAFERSVDIWDENWPELKKRAIIAAAPRLHRLKGTEQGLREGIAFAGGELLKVVVPPSKTFLAPDLTSEQRAEFLSRYAQLRIYPRRSRGPAKGMFPGTRHGFVERHIPVASSAFFRAQPRAFIWDHGVETELTVLDRRHQTETIETQERLDLRMRSRARRNHLNRNRLFALKSTAPRRIFSVNTHQTLTIPGEDRLARRVLSPSITPIDVVAEMVRQRGVRRTAVAGRFFPGATSFLGVVQASRARERVYRRTYIFDPARPLKRRNASTFLGASSRLGMPAHNAEITVRVRYRRPKFAFTRFFPGFVVHREKRELNLVKSAIRSQKRLSDRILINTKTIAPATAGAQIRAGSLRAGQLVETI